MTDPAALGDTLSETLRRTDAGLLWLQPLVLRLLAEGQPVGIEQLAAAAGRSAGEVRAALASRPDTEYDAEGRVVGLGITLRESPHRFIVDGRQLFTWCALDTLMFPAVIGRPAQVVSSSPVSGAVVHVQVEPDRVVAVEPPDAVVSIVTPGQVASIRAAFCHQVHYFTSPTDASGWLDEHPGAQVLPVADAFTLGRGLAERLLHGDGCR